MPVNEEDGLSPEERDVLHGLGARDPELEAELALILPALDAAARNAFWRQLAETGAGARPAAAVLAALVIAARG